MKQHATAVLLTFLVLGPSGLAAQTTTQPSTTTTTSASRDNQTDWGWVGLLGLAGLAGLLRGKDRDAVVRPSSSTGPSRDR